MLFAGTLRFDKSYEIGVAISTGRECIAILSHTVEREGHHQVDLHLLRGAEHPVADGVPTREGAVGKMHGDIQVVEGHVPPGARGSGGRAPE